ncbi:MAG: hydrogenase iron-sulfur subunit [Actinobacteria bacterium]|nr:hydrogenase iron-sulfur subunit [Actinomycetota bacterium]
MPVFRPKIIGYYCQYCAYLSDDNFGKVKIPSNVKKCKLLCSGKLDILNILETFESGIDGIFVVGCKEDECRNINGNSRASRRVNYIKKILEQIGISSERIAVYNIEPESLFSNVFLEASAEMGKKIRGLGPIYK